MTTQNPKPQIPMHCWVSLVLLLLCLIMCPLVIIHCFHEPHPTNVLFIQSVP